MIAPMSGRDALESISELLSVKLDVTGLERMPKDGAFLILGNHPTGITDGIALYDAVKKARPDVLFYANSDAERVCPRFTETLIPVEWVLAKRTRTVPPIPGRGVWPHVKDWLQKSCGSGGRRWTFQSLTTGLQAGSASPAYSIR